MQLFTQLLKSWNLGQAYVIALQTEFTINEVTGNDQDKKVSFNGSQKQLSVPFVIYADLESYIER